ncbi:hypothetical protein [Kitasatospora sp. NPDC088346]|uniref:hypothetical protein n=1 Tax=Kitasatospora sp. NPDC088346 TaxID=3364073 RepID=UPI00382AA056
MESVNVRRAVGGCVRVPAAVVFATVGLLVAQSRVRATWNWCLTQDHEADGGGFLALVSVWAVMVVVLLVLGAVLAELPGSHWYLLPALAVAAAVLSWLHVVGMGAPTMLPGQPEEAACWSRPTFPFLG